MKNNQKKAWLFLLPAIISVTIFSIWPIIRAFIISFQGGPLICLNFNGIENYKYIFADTDFWNSLINTAIYAFMTVPIALAIALALAWFVFSKIRHQSFFEAMFFMPYVTSTIATGIVFRYIFNGKYGLLDFVLKMLHLPAPDWLDDPSMSLISLIIFGIWSSLAFNIVILIGALRNIDPNYYVLADMYGANESEKFWRITIPQLFPTLAFLLTVNLIGAFKVYTQVFALFNGSAGQGNSAITSVFYIYNKFQVANTPGVAMAATVCLFLFILFITCLQRKLMKRVNS